MNAAEKRREAARTITVTGERCCDCDKDTQPLTAHGDAHFKAWDFYIASDDAWIEAGMARKRQSDKKRWRTGFLCMSRLRRRLGRRPVPGTDLLCWTTSASDKGLKMAGTPEYVARVLRGRGY